MLLNQARFERLIEIGIALSAEKDTNKLMERILLEAKDLGNADGGSLYIRTAEDTLEFAIIRNDSLELAQTCRQQEELQAVMEDIQKIGSLGELRAVR